MKLLQLLLLSKRLMNLIDRLHVAILACLLHKRVHFYKGGYFKNEAVFRSSMRDYFDDVFMKKY